MKERSAIIFEFITRFLLFFSWCRNIVIVVKPTIVRLMQSMESITAANTVLCAVDDDDDVDDTEDDDMMRTRCLMLISDIASWYVNLVVNNRSIGGIDNKYCCHHNFYSIRRGAAQVSISTCIRRVHGMVGCRDHDGWYRQQAASADCVDNSLFLNVDRRHTVEPHAASSVGCLRTVVLNRHVLLSLPPVLSLVVSLFIIEQFFQHPSED